MLFTRGVMKIFQVQGGDIQREDFFVNAKKLGFKVALFNGTIYQVAPDGTWFESPFKMSDFEA